MPPSDVADGLEWLNVELESETVVETRVIVPRGQGSGMGWLPGGAVAVRGWQVDMSQNPETRSSTWAWSLYHPGAQQAALMLWQLLNAPGRPMFWADTGAMARAWDTFWERILSDYYNTDYHPQNRARLRNALDPFFYVMGSKGQGFFAKVPKAEYDIVPDSEGFRWANGTMRALTCRAAYGYYLRRTLRARQEKALGTLQVAYVSRDDPAFRDDALLDLLQKRRAQLLAHPRRYDVDLSRVPDADYRDALFDSRVAGKIKGLKPSPGAKKGVIHKLGPLEDDTPPPEPDPPKPPELPQGGLGAASVAAVGGAAALYFLL